MPAREPRNTEKPVGKGFKGDTRSLDSSKPLTPFTPVEVDDLNQLKATYEFELDNYSGTCGLAHAIHHRFKRMFPSTLESTGQRRIVVDLATGQPQDSITGEHHGLIPLDGPVTLYAVIEDIENPVLFRLVIIGTTRATTFLFIKEDKAFIVDFEESSTSTLEAIANLYGSCLDKGVDHFNEVLGYLPDLFYKLFFAVATDPTQIDFKVWHTKGEEVKLRLYLYPEEPNQNILSGNGYCWHVDLNQFPSRHISRGYSLRQWEQNRRSRDTSCGRVTSPRISRL